MFVSGGWGATTAQRDCVSRLQHTQTNWQLLHLRAIVFVFLERNLSHLPRETNTSLSYDHTPKGRSRKITADWDSHSLCLGFVCGQSLTTFKRSSMINVLYSQRLLQKAAFNI